MNNSIMPDANCQLTKKKANAIVKNTFSEQQPGLALSGPGRKMIIYAEVAEQADAPVSKTGEGNFMRVRFPPSAFFFLQRG